MLLACALAVSGCSVWGPKEQRAFAFSAACHVTDLMQTDWALEHGYREMNPLYGDRPSDNQLVAGKAAALAATWWVAEQYEGDDRWKVIALATVPCLAVVAHNYREGARP